MDKRYKRLLSWVLCLTLCFSVLPITSAVAVWDPELPAEGATIIPKQFGSDDDFLEKVDAWLESIDPDVSGNKDGVIVFRYTPKGTDEDDARNDDAARIDVGLYKIGDTQTMDITIKYKLEDVILQSLAGKSSTILKDCNTNDNLERPRAVVPLKYTNDIVSTPGFDQRYTFENAGVANEDERGYVFQTPDDTYIEIKDDGTYGRYLVTLSIGFNDTTSTPNALNHLKSGEGAIKQLNTTGIPSVFYFGALYFKETSENSIDGETFALGFSDGNGKDGVNGAFATSGTKTATVQTAFVGFLQPEKEPEPQDVAVTVYPTAALTGDGNTTWLKSAVVKIWPEDKEADTKTYSVGANGVLTEGDAVDGKISLMPGKYFYSVEPTDEDDKEFYEIHNDSFMVEETKTKAVKIYAQEIDTGEPEPYIIQVLDGASAGKASPFALNTDIIFAPGGTKAVDADGLATISTSANTKAFSISKTGYLTKTATVEFKAGGEISGNGFTYDAEKGVNTVVLEKTTTKVTLTAGDDPVVPDGYISVSPNPGGYVNDFVREQLPITKATDENGKAEFTLPDGDYSYRITSPGNEDSTGTFSIRDGIVYMNPTDVGDPTDGPGTVDVGTGTTTNPTGDGETGYTTDGVPAVPVAEIKDRLYYAVGEWGGVDPEKPEFMTVEVWLKNTLGLSGTYSLRYDTALFDAPTTGFVLNTDKFKIGTVEANPAGTSIPITNPDFDNGTVPTIGYHTFYWESKEIASNQPVDSTIDDVLLATYTLPVKQSVKDAGTYKDVIHSLSLTVRPYYKTDAGAEIVAAYGSALASYATEYLGLMWKDIDTAKNTDPETTTGSGYTYRYAPWKASQGGFLQVMDADDKADATMHPSDIRSQFIFNYEGNVGVVFKAEDSEDGTPIPDVVVTVTDPETGDEIGTGKTDPWGEVIIGLPGDDEYPYEAEVPGYEKTPGVVDVNGAEDTPDETISMKKEDSHKVRIDDTQKDKIALVGAPTAKNSEPYYFNLSPLPGYAWVGNNPPTPAQIIVKFASGTILSDAGTPKVTWDSSKNMYVLDGSVIVNPITEDIVISVVPGVLEDVGTSTSTLPKVYVNAGTAPVNTDGSFMFAAYVGSPLNNYTPSTPATKMNSVVETMGIGNSESGKYTFTPDGRDAATRQAMTVDYEDFVIDELIVNGVSQPLTDNERIYGIKDYYLVGITVDQTITVTFGKAWIRAGETDTPDDDVIIDPDHPDDPTDPNNPPIDPESDAVVSLTVGSYGKATVTSHSNENVPGYTHKDFTVASGSFEATINAEQTVSQPDTTTAYIIDLVVVNGVVVYADTLGVTNNLSGVTMTFAASPGADDGIDGYGYQSGKFKIDSSLLTDGEVYSVVVTFKPAKTVDNPTPKSIFTIVALIKTAGEGTAEANNPGNKVEMPYVTYTFTPDTGYKMGGIVTTPVAEVPGMTVATSRTDNVGGSTATDYTLSDLGGGYIVITYDFVQTMHKVEFTVCYGILTKTLPNAGTLLEIKPDTHATFTFTRTTGGAPLVIDSVTDQPITGSLNNLITTTTYNFNLPAGTWTVKVSKDGYLDYEVTGFKINADGSADNTHSSGGTIYFGRNDSTETTEVYSRALNPRIGDATWDQMLIAVNDIAQVANGMGSSNPARVEHADMNQDGAVDVLNDMSYVTGGLGRINTKMSYTQFMTDVLLVNLYTN